MRKNDISLIDIPLALVLLTRLPIPRLSATTFQRQAQSVWAFPLAGAAVSLLACALAWTALMLGLTPGLAAGVFIAVQIVSTGAMHEDGLADCADGFWGGYETGRRLEIMKDSQIGTYGVLSIVVVLGVRWQAVALLLMAQNLWSLLALAMLSRAFMPFLMRLLPNARKSGLSQSVGRPGLLAVVAGLGLALLLSLPLLGVTGFGVAMVMAVAALALAFLAKRKIGGQTGDVLGACQQLCELAGLLYLVALLT